MGGEFFGSDWQGAQLYYPAEIIDFFSTLGAQEVQIQEFLNHLFRKKIDFSIIGPIKKLLDSNIPAHERKRIVGQYKDEVKSYENLRCGTLSDSFLESHSEMRFIYILKKNLIFSFLKVLISIKEVIKMNQRMSEILAQPRWQKVFDQASAEFMRQIDLIDFHEKKCGYNSVIDRKIVAKTYCLKLMNLFRQFIDYDVRSLNDEHSQFWIWITDSLCPYILCRRTNFSEEKNLLQIFFNDIFNMAMYDIENALTPPYVLVDQALCTEVMARCKNSLNNYKFIAYELKKIILFESMKKSEDQLFYYKENLVLFVEAVRCFLNVLDDLYQAVHLDFGKVFMAFDKKVFQPLFYYIGNLSCKDQGLFFKVKKALNTLGFSYNPLIESHSVYPNLNGLYSKWSQEINVRMLIQALQEIPNIDKEGLARAEQVVDACWDEVSSGNQDQFWNAKHLLTISDLVNIFDGIVKKTITKSKTNQQ